MEVTGKVKALFELQTFDSGFRKRELIVTTAEQYPQDISIEFLQDKVDLLDKYKEGDDVSVSINLRGREWTNKEGVTRYFNSISGWKIEAPKNVTPSMPTAPPIDMGADSNYPDLPF